MKPSPWSKFVGLALVCTAALLWLAAPAAALSPQDELGALGAGLFLFMFLFALAVYAFFCYCLYLIAKKAGVTENLWLVWIPILQMVPMLNVAKKPIWWIVLLFIPLVNIVILVLVWMAVAEARGKPGWWGILMILPVLNLVAILYLAFSD